MDSASLVTPLVINVMLVVQAPAQNVALKMFSRNYFCMQESVRHLAQVDSMGIKTTGNVNLAFHLAAVVLVLQYLIVCLVVRDTLGLELQLAHVLKVALRVSCTCK